MIELIAGILFGILLHGLVSCSFKNEFSPSIRKWDYINAKLAEIKWRPIIIADNELEIRAALDELDERQNDIGRLQAMKPQDPEAPWNQKEARS